MSFDQAFCVRALCSHKAASDAQLFQEVLHLIAGHGAFLIGHYTTRRSKESNPFSSKSFNKSHGLAIRKKRSSLPFDCCINDQDERLSPEKEEVQKDFLIEVQGNIRLDQWSGHLGGILSTFFAILAD